MAIFKHNKKKYTKIKINELTIEFTFHDIGTVTAMSELEGENHYSGYGNSKEDALFDLMVKLFGE
jgi:hypothetical protein